MQLLHLVVEINAVICAYPLCDKSLRALGGLLRRNAGVTLFKHKGPAAMSMQNLVFRIIIYPSESEGMGRWTAHCLDLDVLADDDTLEGAVSELLEVIEAQLDAAAEYEASPFQNAPKEYWDRLDRAKPVAAELLERITLNANRRSTAHPAPRLVLRQEEDACA